MIYDEISKYDIELFLDQYDLSMVDAYIDNSNQLIMEINKNIHGKDVDQEMILAELEQSFSSFKSVSHDPDFEKFIVNFDNNDTILVD